MRRGSDEVFFLQKDSRQVNEEQSGDEKGSRTIEGLGELCEVEQACFDGWRYLGLDDSIILSKTPREFSILMRANTERIYDELERKAVEAIMVANASNSRKRIKPSDLFKRPTEYRESKRTVEDLRREEQETMKWLSQFEEFKGKINNGEEETDG